jgi:hypothetical protein
MKAEIVEFVNGNWTVIDTTIETILKEQSYTYNGNTEIGSYLRPELQNQPIFKELAGPMYSGKPDTLRYESWKAYDILSR